MAGPVTVVIGVVVVVIGLALFFKTPRTGNPHLTQLRLVGLGLVAFGVICILNGLFPGHGAGDGSP